MATRLTLELLPGTLAVCRLEADTPLPAWAVAGDFLSLTRTDAELSIVCPQERVPAGVRAEPGWRCLRVKGRLAFGLTGVLASLATPLADAGVSLFALSTYETDYVMVQGRDLALAIEALERAGHTVERVPA